MKRKKNCSHQSKTRIMTNKFSTLESLMEEVKQTSELVQDACIRFGTAKAKLQLEIYRLVKDENTSSEEMTEMIDKLSATELDKDNKTITKHNKFFRET